MVVTLFDIKVNTMEIVSLDTLHPILPKFFFYIKFSTRQVQLEVHNAKAESF
jgi:hypothetical protein